MNKLQFSKRYTPESISNTKDIFSIPIYQRLFEWDEPRITQLLYDLKKSYLNTDNKEVLTLLYHHLYNANIHYRI